MADNNQPNYAYTRELDKIYAELSLNQYSTHKVTDFTHFNRFHNHSETTPVTTGIAYLFFTKPNLHLSYPMSSNKDIKGEDFIKEAVFYNIPKCQFLSQMYESKKGRQLMGLLCHKGASSYDPKTSPKSDTLAPDIENNYSNFMPLLTNYALSFSPRDTEIEDEEIGENFVGSKISYGKCKFKSETVSSFDISYDETIDMNIIYLHKMWVDYIHNVRYGMFVTHSDNLKHRVLDYVSSLYYFLLDPSGSKIQYYCKYTGVYPTAVPYSALQWDLGTISIPKINIQYNYSFKEDLNPEILREFNAVSRSGRNVEIKDALLDSTMKSLSNYMMESNWRNTPMVVQITDTDKEQILGYHLTFIELTNVSGNIGAILPESYEAPAEVNQTVVTS